MENIRSVEPGKFNTKLADALKKSQDVQKPEWVDFVKTGTNKNRPTTDEDFWYKRAASILRQIYIYKIVGVERLRTRFGGRKDRGMKPPRFAKAGGKIIRTIVQQAEASGLIEKSKTKKAGRQMTQKGRDLLESIK